MRAPPGKALNSDMVVCAQTEQCGTSSPPSMCFAASRSSSAQQGKQPSFGQWRCARRRKGSMGMKGSSSARWERKLADHCWMTVRSGDTPRECERERGRLAPSDCPPRYGSLPRRPREIAVIQSATTHQLQPSLTLSQTVHRRQRRPFPIRRRPPRRRGLRRERPLRGARPARAPSQRPAAQTRRVGVNDG